MDLLKDKEKHSLTEIISLIDEEYLSNFSKPLGFDESTIRKKLAEYEKEGIIEIFKEGNKSVYSLKDNINLISRRKRRAVDIVDKGPKCRNGGHFGGLFLPQAAWMSGAKAPRLSTGARSLSRF